MTKCIFFSINTGFLEKFTCTLLGRLRDDEEVLEALALVLDELAFCFGGNAGAPLGPTLNSPRISWTSRLVLLVSCRSPLSSVEVRSVKIPIWISKLINFRKSKFVLIMALRSLRVGFVVRLKYQKWIKILPTIYMVIMAPRLLSKFLSKIC